MKVYACIFYSAVVAAIVRTVRLLYGRLHKAIVSKITIENAIAGLGKDYMVGYQCMRIVSTPNDSGIHIDFYWYLWAETATSHRNLAEKHRKMVLEKIPDLKQKLAVKQRGADTVTGVMAGTPEVGHCTRMKLIDISEQLLNDRERLAKLKI